MSPVHKNRIGKRRRLAEMVAAVLPVALLGAAPAFAQPPNDECETANVLPSSAPFPPFTDIVDGTDATLNPNDPLLSCNAAGDDDGTQTVWWEYTPDASGLAVSAVAFCDSPSF